MKRYTIWSSGGGVQSTAIAVLILKGLLPRPDVAVIADTGRETQETWDYLEKVVNPTLQKQFFDFKVQRLPRKEPPALWNGNGTLLIPAYEAGQPKLANFCSSYWKRDVVKAWAVDNSWIPAVNWLGISTDEMKRVSTPRANNWLLEYPLISMVPRSRSQCLAEISEFGWPEAPKSSCWMCPNRRNDQWRHLRPEEFKKACEVDEEIRTRNPNAYLHRSLVRLAEADLGTESSQGTFGCDSGECFV